MKKLLLISVFIIFCTYSIFAQEVFEMRSTAKGFSVELHAGITGWTCDDLEVKNESGFHYGLKAGYGFSEKIEAFIEYNHSIIFPEMEEFSPFPYEHLDIGARFNFGSTIKAFRPFVEVTALYQSSIQDAVETNTWEYLKLDMQGYGLSVGGGLKYHLKLPMVLMIGGKYSFGTFDTIKIDGEDYSDEWVANSYRFYFGVAYFF